MVDFLSSTKRVDESEAKEFSSIRFCLGLTPGRSNPYSIPVTSKIYSPELVRGT